MHLSTYYVGVQRDICLCFEVMVKAEVCFCDVSCFKPFFFLSNRPVKFTEKPRPGVQMLCSSFSVGKACID